MGFDAREVANFLLDYAESHHRPITHLSLQKILFFCHGWYLARFDEPLISEPVEAWAHGPVYRSVYHCLKSSKNEYIKTRARKMDYSTGDCQVIAYNFDDDVGEFIQNIFDLYSRYKASDLRQMSHVKGGPWETIWSKAGSHPIAGMRIPDEITKVFYRTNTHSLIRQ
jgi:uncharacterized phage-associated protein